MHSRMDEEQIYSFLTSALDRSNRLPGPPILSKWKKPSNPLIRKLGGPQEPIWKFWKRIKSLGHAMN
jgi:hypothetical protein